jgi:hypothetical protein
MLFLKMGETNEKQKQEGYTSAQTIHEDGPFPVSGSSPTITNHDSLSSCVRGFNPGKRSLKSTYLNELDVRKPLVVFISQGNEELRLYNLV